MINYTLVYALRIYVRYYNARYYLFYLSPQRRVTISAVLILLSYGVIALCPLLVEDLKNGNNGTPEEQAAAQPLDFSDWKTYCLLALTLGPLYLSSAAAALSESAIVGYLRTFHPD